MKKLQNQWWHSLGLIALLLATPCGLRAENLLKNADFANVTAGNPVGWKPYANKQTLSGDTQQTTGDSKQSLRVDIIADGGKSLGQIVQKVQVTPNKKYLLTLDMKSSVSGAGVGQIKLLVGNSEIQRMVTSKSTTEWSTVKLEFSSGEANLVWVVLRYDQKPTNVGQKVWFANASLVEMVPPAAAAANP